MTLSERKTLMKHSPSLPWRALKGALAIGAAAAASLALAGVASADVLVITPDTSTSDHLTQAITTANGNSSAINTIVLTPGRYSPLHQPITITKNLNIVGDHAFQTPQGTGVGIEINGAIANAAAQDNFFVVNSGVTLRMDGLNFDSAGATTFAGVQVNGTLNTWGVTFDGAFGWSVVVGPTGTANLNFTTLNSDLAPQLQNNNNMTLNNDDILSGNGTAIANTPSAGGALRVTNTVIANNFNGAAKAGCIGSPPANAPAPGSIDDVGTCGFADSNDPNIDNFVPFGDDGNGGPETTMDLTASSPSHNFGVNCPTTDGRFFVNPPNGSGGRSCDSGVVTDGATQQTTGPTCKITSTAADRSSQTVTVADASSGEGPQASPVTDNPSNTPATTYPPPAAVPVPSYAVSNAQISNGSIAAFMPFTAPSNNGVTITASKTTAGTPTQWSFTGINWAGVSNNCF
jgi:hypothetical protein